MMKHILVFCGSSCGADGQFVRQARILGEILAARQIGLVYGGGKIGLMGALADAVLAAGGQVTGVIPRFMDHPDIAHHGVSELLLVDTMHERKALMLSRADGLIALPGGYGTLEELFEALTWSQLGLHAKPVAALNVSGFFDPLLVFLDRMAAQQMLQLDHRNALLVDADPQRLLARMACYAAPQLPKWLSVR